MNPIQDTEATTQAVEQVIAGVSADQLDAPTPCAQWNVRELMNHIIGGTYMFAAARRGDAVPEPGAEMPDMVGDDPAASYRSGATQLLEAFGAPGALEEPVTLPFAELPGAAALSLMFADQLTHGWDLAQATGQELAVDDSLSEAALATWQGMIQPEFRDGNTFAAEQPVADDASALERLAAFTGRSV